MHKNIEMIIVSLNRLKNGLFLISESVSNAGNSEEYHIAKKIMNGETKEGFAQNRFFDCFSHSFDEEISNLKAFLEDFEEEYRFSYPEPPTLYTTPIEGHNILYLLKGFRLMNDSFSQIMHYCNIDNETRKSLVSFIPVKANFNPFKLYGIDEWAEKLRMWRIVFEKELEVELGRKKFNKYKHEPWLV